MRSIRLQLSTLSLLTLLFLITITFFQLYINRSSSINFFSQTNDDNSNSILSQFYRRSRRSLQKNSENIVRPRIIRSNSIAPRVGEVEFYKISNQKEDLEGDRMTIADTSYDGFKKDQKVSNFVEKLKSLIQMKLNTNNDETNTPIIRQNGNSESEIEFLASHEAPLTPIGLSNSNYRKNEKNYPKTLLEKIKSNDNFEYYMNLINNANLQIDGKDLNWYGYDKVHKFSIEREKLDKMDVNELKITDDLAQIFGRPKDFENQDQKAATSAVSNKGVVKFTPKKLNKDIASWAMENSKIPSKLVDANQSKTKSLLIINPLSAEIPSLDLIFNQHSETFYNYEPLKIISDGCASDKTMDDKVEFLNEIINCQFNDLSDKLQTLKSNFGSNGAKTASYIGKGNMVFRFKSDRLCRNEFCEGKDFSMHEEKCMKECPDVDLIKASEVCREKLPVAKVIRLCNINALQPILQNENNESQEEIKSYSKILYTLKDPRQIAYQRMSQLKWNPVQIVSSMKWTCQDMMKSLKTILFDQPDWIENRVLVLRSEDFYQNSTIWSDNVLKMAQILSPETENKRLKKMIKTEAKEIDSWRYNLKKDDEKSLSISVIEQIESVCSSLMDIAGYKKVVNNNGEITEYENVISADKQIKFY